MVACLDDDAHVAEQRKRYAARRETVRGALQTAGFRVQHSEAGLYVWATRDEDCWTTVDALAGVGVLVAPGEFYGTAGRQHVRVALTATDERIDQMPERLAALVA
jgi:aspartate/methionine/tyrosine aminotransferase